MGIKLYICQSIENCLEQLKDECEEIQKDIFNSLHFSTQTTGIINYLKLKLAERLNILAHYKFYNPQELIKEISASILENKKNKLSSLHYKWSIYSVLGENSFKIKFPEIYQYFEKDELKKFLLATKISDLFDQYEAYRPEMIQCWLNHEFNYKDHDEEWQSYLWLKCNQIFQNKNIFKHNHLEKVIEALSQENEQEKIRKKYKRIFLIGISSMTKNQWQFFNIIGKFIPVSIYLIDPSPTQKWLDDDTEIKLESIARKRIRNSTEDKRNPILVNLGELIQNNYRTILDLPNHDIEVFDLPTSSNTPETLLEKIQNDLKENKSEKNRNEISDKNIKDESITINSCYNIQREVEVLYNYLCRQIENKKLSSVRSALIMVPDIDTYKPFIDAVFKNSPYELPYKIMGSKSENTNQLSQALLKLLQFKEDEFNAPKIFSLLENKLIKIRFGIENTEIIREAIEKSGMRRNFYGDRNIETDYSDFNNGINRILLGYCIKNTETIKFSDKEYQPVEITDGKEIHNLFSFCHFLEVLNENIENRKNNKTIKEWVNYLKASIKNFIIENIEIENSEYDKILYYLQELEESMEYFNGKIPYNVFYHELEKKLTTEEGNEIKSGNGIIFCDYIFARSVPYDYIGMLGLNFNEFPRKNKNLKFNLLFKYPETSDRNLKINDKHLFLEAILNCRKAMYFSYIGKNDGDNTKKLPSSVLEDLIEYIENKQGLKHRLTTFHPLQSYSTKYNSKENPALYSYLGDFHGIQLKKTKSTPQEDKISNEINLDNLIRFYKNPFKYFYNKKLGIYYSTDEQELEKNEVFEMNYFHEKKIKTDLIKIKKDDLEKYRKKLILINSFPLNNISKVKIEELYNEMLLFQNMFSILSENKPERISKDILVTKNNISLIYKIKNIHDNKLIEIYFDSFYNNLLSIVIKHLTLCCTSEFQKSHFINYKDKNVITLKKIEKDEALNHLNYLIELYLSATESPLPYYNKFSDAPKCWKIGSDAHELFRDKINANKFPLQDPYIIKEFENGYFLNEEINKKYIEICLDINEIINNVIEKES